MMCPETIAVRGIRLGHVDADVDILDESEGRRRWCVWMMKGNKGGRGAVI